MLAERREVLARSAEWLGGDTGLFSLGPRPQVLGKPAPPINGASQASLNDPSLWSDVNIKRRNLKVPAFVATTLDGVKDGALIAISVNGKVAASARSFLFKGQHWAGSADPAEHVAPRAQLDRDLPDRKQRRAHSARRQLGLGG